MFLCYAAINSYSFELVLLVRYITVIAKFRFMASDYARSNLFFVVRIFVSPKFWKIL